MAAILLFGLAAWGGDAAAADAPELTAWLQSRSAIAQALSQPIAICVARRDTNHPAFHGCVDWHSAVHGVWALMFYRRMTGDRANDALITAALEPKAIAAERRALAADSNFEMPYGRAWFLALAIEAHRQSGREDILEFGREVAASLVAYYRSHPASPYAQAYDSASWALINLFRFGEYARDQGMVDFVRQTVRARWLAAAPDCDAGNEEKPRPQFMAVCVNGAWLAASALSAADGLAWARRFAGDADRWQPVSVASNAHHYGLNFSRAWGFWGLYRATGEAHYARAFLRHFEANFSRPDWWRGEYLVNAHWVAQFGMMALALSYEDRP